MMKWFMSISDKYYQQLSDGQWRPWIKEPDLRRSFSVEYMAMRSRFRAKKEIIPVLLADVLFHLFSDNIKERNFMDVTAEYPLGYTAQNGPVPIKMASASAPYATNGPAASSPKGNGVYRWTDDQYRWAILALRAISAPPQYHVDSNKRNQHASSKNGGVKTCHDLFPSMFLGQDRWSSGGWDKDQFACSACDAHTMIFTYIAVAELRRLNRGGLSTNTVIPSQVRALVENLEQRRYKYEDFWNLISQRHSQGSGCGDSGNAWAMKKLARLDWENSHTRSAHWNHLKVKVIKKEIASYKKGATHPAPQNHAGNDDDNGPLVPDPITGTTSTKIEIDLSDSDDDLVELWNHVPSQRGSISAQTKKRNHEQVDTKAVRESKKIKNEDR